MKTYTYSRWVHRLMIGMIYALALLQPLSVSTSSHSPFIISPNYPDIKGTWYVNGDSNQVVTITQNGANLYFASSQYSSKGQFVDQRRIYASDWNTYATLSDDLNTITWDNQIWTRATQQPPTVNDLSGNWYVNGDASQVAIITQNGNQLSFTVGGNSSNGYFKSANQVHATAWNAYANISTDGKTLTWGNQTWNRAPVQGVRTQN